jgi:hypothetical protein
MQLCYKVRNKITLQTALWHCARTLHLAHVRRAQRIVALHTSLTTPSCTHHHVAHDYRPSLRWPSPFIRPVLTVNSPPKPPPLTPAPHSAALRPSFRGSSPFALPHCTPDLHCAALQALLRHSLPLTLQPSQAAFTSPPFILHSTALHPSLPPFTLHSAPLHPSLPHHSLPPITRRPSNPPFTLPLCTLHSTTLYPSLPQASLPPSTAPPITHRSAAL